MTGILGGFKGFFMSVLGYVAVGYLFFYLYSNYYTTYASNYLYLGLLIIGFGIAAGLIMKLAVKLR